MHHAFRFRSIEVAINATLKQLISVSLVHTSYQPYSQAFQQIKILIRNKNIGDFEFHFGMCNQILKLNVQRIRSNTISVDDDETLLAIQQRFAVHIHGHQKVSFDFRHKITMNRNSRYLLIFTSFMLTTWIMSNEAKPNFNQFVYNLCLSECPAF